MSKAPLENVISTKSATMNNQLYNSTAMAQLGSHEITKNALKDCLIQVLNSHPCKDAKILRSKNYYNSFTRIWKKILTYTYLHSIRFGKCWRCQCHSIVEIH